MNKFALSVALGLLVFVRADSSTEESFDCENEGRFADPFDCSHYFECVADEFGSLTEYKRSCHGKAFNPQTLTCTDPSKVKGCKIREGRQYSPSTRYNELCSNSSDNFVCGDCGTMLMCSDAVAYATKCEANLRCKTEMDGFGGAICHPDYDEECKCRGGNTYYQDLYYNGTFFFCKEQDSNPIFFNCPSGMHFDEDTISCKNEDGLPACTESGIFTYPDNCTKYYTCTYALEGWIQSRFKCPADALFNVETGNCENPCGWASDMFECKDEGRFRDPKDCNQFFECVKSLSGNMITMMRSCPPNYHWNDESNRCIKSKDSECKPDTEGPLKHCKKDYKIMCSEGSSIPLPQNEEGNTPAVEAVDQAEEQVEPTTPNATIF